MILRNIHNLIECLECVGVGGVSNILSANVLLRVVNILNLNIKNTILHIFLILLVRRICFKVNNNFFNTKHLFKNEHHFSHQFSTFLLLLYLFSKDVKRRNIGI